jgi:hypothetical protein
MGPGQLQSINAQIETGSGGIGSPIARFNDASRSDLRSFSLVGLLVFTQHYGDIVGSMLG